MAEPVGSKVKTLNVWPPLLSANGKTVSSIKVTPLSDTSFIVGPGLIKIGDVLSVNVDGTSIIINSLGQLEAIGGIGPTGPTGPTGPAGPTGPTGLIDFYYQQTRPTPDPLTLGARWIDSDNGIEFVWVFDGLSYVWMQPTQLGGISYKTFYINTSVYFPNFYYEYLGVIYTSGICTVTLPIGTIADEGKFITIADEVGGISYGNRGILVQGQAGQNINGSSSVLMKLERMSLTFLYRNNSWKTI